MARNSGPPSEILPSRLQGSRRPNWMARAMTDKGGERQHRH